MRSLPFMTLLLLGLVVLAKEISSKGTPWDRMGVTCERETVKVTIRNHMGCSKTGVRVRFCRGTCKSASRFLSYWPFYESACRCCRKNGIEKRVVLLTCPNGSRMEKTIEYAKSCACQDCT